MPTGTQIGRPRVVDDRPQLVIEIKIEPKSAADADRLISALATMATGDAAFGYSRDAESGELTVMGVDERSLDAHIGALETAHKIEVLLGAPQVRYRETLAASVDIDYTHKKLIPHSGEFARIKLRAAPNVAGAGNEFRNETDSDVVPSRFIPGIEKGVQSVWNAGVLIGFPMVDTRVTLYDGDYHETDSSVGAFEVAARVAMREATVKAGVNLLEPVMSVEAVIPSYSIGSVIGDLNSRRGHIVSQEVRGTDQAINAEVPLATLFGYQRDFRSLTSGLGRYAIHFSHYARVSPLSNGPDNFPPAVGMRA
jgi:elongation factor G